MVGKLYKFSLLMPKDEKEIYRMEEKTTINKSDYVALIECKIRLDMIKKFVSDEKESGYVNKKDLSIFLGIEDEQCQK